MRKQILFVACLLCMGTGHASPVDGPTALRKAQAFFSEKQADGLRASSPVEPELAYVCVGDTILPASSPTLRLRSDEAPSLYLFRGKGGQGFAVVSGEDRTDREILAYSLDGKTGELDSSSPAYAWLMGYAEQIAVLRSMPALDRTEPVAKQTPAEMGFPAEVEPLIETQWDQYYPYNVSCPVWQGEYCAVGCNATLLCQLLRYYRYPERPSGHVRYRSDYNGTQLEIDEELSRFRFDWEQMPARLDDASTEAEIRAVADFGYAVGVALTLLYSPTVTSGYISFFPQALAHSFHYASPGRYCQRELYPTDTWRQLLLTELAERRPVPYGGQSVTVGHSFLCDGYDADGLIHINMGTGGYYDGYYELDVIQPEAYAQQGYVGFANQQEMVVGIHPQNAPKPYEPLLEEHQRTVDNGHHTLDFKATPPVEYYTVAKNRLVLTQLLLWTASEDKEIEYRWDVSHDGTSVAQGPLHKRFAQPDYGSWRTGGNGISQYYATRDTLDLSALSEGKSYRLECLWRPTDGGEWRPTGKLLNGDYFATLTPIGDSLRLSRPLPVELPSPLEIDTFACNATDSLQTARLEVVNRSATDYLNSQLSLYISPNGYDSVQILVTQEPLYLRPGERKQLEFTYSYFDLAPGLYHLSYYLTVGGKEDSPLAKGERDVTLYAPSATANEPITPVTGLLRLYTSGRTLTVESTDALQRAEIYDLQGRRLLTRTLPDTPRAEILLPESLPADHYILRLLTSEGEQVRLVNLRGI